MTKFDKNVDLDASNLSIINSITNILSSSLNFKETLNQFFFFLDNHFQVDVGIVCIKDSITDELHPEMFYGLDEAESKIEQKHFSLRNSVHFDVIKNNQPIFYENVSNSPLRENKIRIKNTVTTPTYICIPITIGDEVLGTISIESKFNNSNFFQKRLS